MFSDVTLSFMGSKFNPFVISARQELLLLSFSTEVFNTVGPGGKLENNILTNIFSTLPCQSSSSDPALLLCSSLELIECKWDTLD